MVRALRLLTLFLTLLLASAASVGCRTAYIPNTDVEDTDENREVIEFCEEYRKAVERRNVAVLLQLAHKAYYEDGGNIDATDDIDRTGLESYLRERFRETEAIRYEIRYRQVSEGRKDVINVDFTYSASYRVPSEKGDSWRRKVADNRLQLVRKGESYLIISGM